MLGALPNSGKGKEAQNTVMNHWEQDGIHEEIFPACFGLHTLNHSLSHPGGGNPSQRAMMGSGMGHRDTPRGEL